MAFDIDAYHQFVKLLYDHPEWRAEVRQLVLSEDILALPSIVRELSLSVKELTEAQKRTEQSIRELSEAQKRGEERLTRLEQVVAELSEAQKRTEKRVDDLGVELRKTRREVAGLSASFGATLEEEAASVLEAVMRRKGYLLLDEALTLRLNGDVDVILPVETPEGRRLTIVVESKARLERKEVIGWVQRIKSAGWQKRLAAAGYRGPYLAYVYAIRADIGARDAAAETGIGLLKSEGEIIAPAGEIGA